MSKTKGYLLQPEVKRLNDAFHELSTICIEKGDRKLALDCLRESKNVAQMVADLRRVEIQAPNAAMQTIPDAALGTIRKAIAARASAVERKASKVENKVTIQNPFKDFPAPREWPDPMDTVKGHLHADAGNLRNPQRAGIGTRPADAVSGRDD